VCSSDLAIYAAQNTTPYGSLTVNGPAHLEGNTATAATGGGAVRAEGNIALGDGSGTVTLKDNKASLGPGGGALSSGSQGGVTVTGALDASGNSAGTNGGAIASNGVGGVNLTASPSGNISLTGNTAANFGGAIYAARNMSITGALTASGNQAATGGALFGVINITLNATSGDFLFTGNTQSSSGAPLANAIYMSNAGGAATLTLNAAANRAITFQDPVQANASRFTVSATGGGAVVFDGSNPATASYTPDPWSRVYANTTVASATTFTVKNNAIYGFLASDFAIPPATMSAFTVDAGATLAGGGAGTVRADAFTLNGAINVAGAAGGADNRFTVIGRNQTINGQVIVNACLNTQKSDVLTLDGNGVVHAASGAAEIVVKNLAGCTSAPTTGDGILVVEAAGGVTPRRRRSRSRRRTPAPW
jgi:predicted outer membrane repeat protein